MNPLPLVPEIGSEEEGHTVADEDEDQCPCLVPVFDPFAAELCTDDMITCEGTEIAMADEEGNMIFDDSGKEGTTRFEDASPDIKDLGLLDCKEEDDEKFEDKVVKVKDEQDQLEAIFDWNFNNYESPITGDEEEEEKAVPVADTTVMNSGNKKEISRNVSLRLNYEAVITAWASHGSPWTTGSRPELSPDDCWPDCMVYAIMDIIITALMGALGNTQEVGNAGREARVLRYREKRRTRLFSKKIRYEVRKLNAEKRPRMKGRFVKRTSFMGTHAFPYINK
ncbi:hypothetical protein GH714_026562 [Hevea brasiliensis]|uniref:CCT domain-containing protein n=1 Tax=Hevea brasiliensis TaxID=3981 RepID=A0A6A6LBF0_HEVBR|nr:hypothetical protein GH714_026562 [Hevea brasiliensis]